jgi:hypothetical protein
LEQAGGSLVLFVVIVTVIIVVTVTGGVEAGEVVEEAAEIESAGPLATLINPACRNIL